MTRPLPRIPAHGLPGLALSVLVAAGCFYYPSMYNPQRGQKQQQATPQAAGPARPSAQQQAADRAQEQKQADADLARRIAAARSKADTSKDPGDVADYAELIIKGIKSGAAARGVFDQKAAVADAASLFRAAATAHRSEVGQIACGEGAFLVLAGEGRKAVPSLEFCVRADPREAFDSTGDALFTILEQAGAQRKMHKICKRSFRALRTDEDRYLLLHECVTHAHAASVRAALPWANRATIAFYVKTTKQLQAAQQQQADQQQAAQQQQADQEQQQAQQADAQQTADQQGQQGQDQQGQGQDQQQASAGPPLYLPTADDCKGIVDKDSNECSSGDCKAVVDNDSNECDSADCKAVVDKDVNECSSADCKALVDRDVNECNSGDCKALIDKDSNECDSDACKAVVDNDSNECPSGGGEASAAEAASGSGSDDMQNLASGSCNDITDNDDLQNLCEGNCNDITDNDDMQNFCEGNCNDITDNDDMQNFCEGNCNDITDNDDLQNACEADHTAKNYYEHAH